MGMSCRGGWGSFRVHAPPRPLTRTLSAREHYYPISWSVVSFSVQNLRCICDFHWGNSEDIDVPLFITEQLAAQSATQC